MLLITRSLKKAKRAQLIGCRMREDRSIAMKRAWTNFVGAAVAVVERRHSTNFAGTAVAVVERRHYRFEWRDDRGGARWEEWRRDPDTGAQWRSSWHTDRVDESWWTGHHAWAPR